MKRRVGVVVVLLAVMLMGCRRADVQEKPQVEENNVADVEGDEEDVAVKEEDSLEEEVAEEEGADVAEQEEEEDGMEAAAEVKTPPEGWEFKLTSEDWGLSYGESGTQPVGNATAEDLAWYDAYYVGDDSENVLYLTFDCGYENGNTEPILDALKKHDAKGTFFVVGHFLEQLSRLQEKLL